MSCIKEDLACCDEGCDSIWVTEYSSLRVDNERLRPCHAFMLIQPYTTKIYHIIALVQGIINYFQIFSSLEYFSIF